MLGDELRIDTPEQVALELPIAGVGSRFLAIVVDTLLQGVLYLLVILLFGSFGPAMIAGASRFWANMLFAIAVLGLFCIYWGYFALFEIVWSGQTPGKRVAKIRVIRESGRPIDVTAAILRNLLRAVDFLPAMYGVGVATVVLNCHSRRLGDLLAGTVVVHEREVESLEPSWTSSPRARSAAPSAATITDTELVLIETYLERRWNFSESVRQRAALQIADRITERTGLRPQPGHTVDDFLEAVARQARDAGRLRPRSATPPEAR
jgi:uncharacterized RDD family membrane protein YckC